MVLFPIEKNKKERQGNKKKIDSEENDSGGTRTHDP